MNNEVLFTERQQFRQWWLWLILIGINGMFLFGVIKQVILGQQFGTNPLSNTGLLIIFAISLLLTIFFFSFRLDTEIRKDGIYIKFFPFHASFRKYTWNTISKIYVRQYNPIAEYGGWGLRLGLFGKGKAYNVSGNRGLQIDFTDHKKLLIGTGKPEELTEVLNRFNPLPA